MQGLLRSAIMVEAELNDITYVEIGEEKTSQYCCKCGSLDRKGRNKRTNVFTCKECGVTINGDINATINLLVRYMHEVYRGKDKQTQLDYIYKNLNFDNLLQIEKIKLVKKN